MSNYKTLHRLFVLRIAFELLVSLFVVITFLSRRYFSQLLCCLQGRFGWFFISYRFARTENIC